MTLTRKKMLGTLAEKKASTTLIPACLSLLSLKNCLSWDSRVQLAAAGRGKKERYSLSGAKITILNKQA